MVLAKVSTIFCQPASRGSNKKLVRCFSNLVRECFLGGPTISDVQFTSFVNALTPGRMTSAIYFPESLWVSLASATRSSVIFSFVCSSITFPFSSSFLVTKLTITSGLFTGCMSR
jgi:hypothetical protein